MSDDYTSDVPFDDDNEADAMTVSLGGLLAGKTAQQIEDEATFPQIEPGVYDGHIAKFQFVKHKETGSDFTPFAVFVEEDQTSFSARKLQVFLTLQPENGEPLLKNDGTPFMQTDFFVLPPDDPTEIDAYERGSKKQGSKQGAGWHARELKQFLSHLGLCDDQGELTEEAGALANWKRWSDGTPRYIRFTVERTTNDQGKEYSQVKAFSYADSPLNNAPPAEPPPPPARTAAPPPRQPAPAQRPAQPARQPATAAAAKPAGRKRDI